MSPLEMARLLLVHGWGDPVVGMPFPPSDGSEDLQQDQLFDVAAGEPVKRSCRCASAADGPPPPERLARLGYRAGQRTVEG